MSTFTGSKDLELVPRGADVGVWDTPTNSNWGIVDNALGGVATIDMSAGSIVLAPNQFQCSQLKLINNLPSNASITLPTTFTGFYTVQNLCGNSSQFGVTVQTTAASGGGIQVCGMPPGEATDIFNDGANIKFRNLARIGAYEDWACSSAPLWVTLSTPQNPYLLCDGSALSSATYPFLSAKVGPLLPDLRGRIRFMLNLGTARTVIVNGRGLDANTFLSSGGQNLIDATCLPSYNLPYTDPLHTHAYFAPGANLAVAGTGNVATSPSGGFSTTFQSATGLTIQSGGGGGSYIPNALVHGITMIRAG